MDAEEEAGGESGLDCLESGNFGLAARDDDLKQLCNDRVNVMIERTERGNQLRRWLGAEEAVGVELAVYARMPYSTSAHLTRTVMSPSR